MSIKSSALFLFSILTFTGCTTVAKYESRTAAGPAKPVDYPIYMYPKNAKVPRLYEIIGTMQVGDTPFTVIGGSLDGELKSLQEKARQQGADALHLTSVEPPGFLHSKYRVEANVLRFTDTWESIPVSENELFAYMRTNAQALDPLEGIWSVNDAARSRVGIMKNNSRPGRNFVAFILGTSNPTWHIGDKKMDIVFGERPGTYRGKCYLDDYRSESVVFNLGGPRANAFRFQISVEGPFIVFSKEGTGR